MEKDAKTTNTRIILGLVVALLVLLALGFYYYSRNHRPAAPNGPESYTVIANETDGPEQIFEKAYSDYAKAHNQKISPDELRLVAEYMAANNLTGKAYWIDKNGQRHELWIGTGDEIILTSHRSTFVISNAYTSNQKKSIDVSFGFDDATAELQNLRNQLNQPAK